MQVYFDNAATTPMRPEVITAMHHAMQSSFGNPSSTHSFGREARALIETARKAIAATIGAEASEIIFTSGGTESDNSLLRAAVKDLGIQTIISSPLEHHAVLHTLDELSSSGTQIHYVSILPDSQVDMVHLEQLLRSVEGPTLVTLMHVNNEIGTILDLNKIAALCQAHQALFHTDAVQGVGHFDLDLSTVPIDFLSAAAHKFHGPKGVGFSFIRKGSGMLPFIVGGAQEKGLRAGTEAVHSIVGMQKALELAYQNLSSERQYILDLKKRFVLGLQELFPKMRLNGLCGDWDQSTYTLVNVALPINTAQSQLLDFQLDLKGIACSKGSACQSGSSSLSHVLSALPAPDIESTSLRFSFSCFNTTAEVDYVLDVLKAFA